jgi:hypothetical protein
MTAGDKQELAHDFPAQSQNREIVAEVARPRRIEALFPP